MLKEAAWPDSIHQGANATGKIVTTYAEGSLDLLGTPALVGFAHVRGGLDRRNELEGDVSETDEGDQRTIDDAQHVVVQQNGTDEDVDCWRKWLATEFPLI